MGIIVVGLGIAVIVALFSPWASSHPDGLEKVAEDKEFIGEAEDAPYEIIPDYTFPGVENEKVATILSGLVGIVIVAALGFGFAFLMKATRRRNGGSHNPGAG
ncbi:MAG: hypothetical protein GEU75_05685 [Dehalococcoidia bacterium]|nr:hypothetical protein [Dehalococcoidia bacterium]